MRKQMREGLWLVLSVLVALAGNAAVAQNRFTLFDDGDPLYNGGIYDLGGAGRPAAATASGAPYSGKEYLTIWGDRQRDTCRDASRVSAFIRSDVGLDMRRDWWITFDVTNDLVSPDMLFNLFLLDYQPDRDDLDTDYWPNWGWRSTFVFNLGDQLPNEDDRGGFAITAIVSGAGPQKSLLSGPRLDPEPDSTTLRGGHNRVLIEWFASTGTYRWTISNSGGTRVVEQAASELYLHPTTIYIAAGNPNIGSMQGTAWTLWDISYGQETPVSFPTQARFVVDAEHRLMLDDRVRESVDGLRLVQGAIARHSSTPLIGRQYDWEAGGLDMNTVVRDPASGFFRMWYRAMDASWNNYLCYATSTDGISWTERLDVGLLPFQGNPNTNILNRYAHVIFWEPDDPDPARRYKGFYWRDLPPDDCHYGHGSTFSANGLNWTIVNADCGKQIKGLTGVCYDESISRYVALSQYQHSPRTTGRHESRDFVSWATEEIYKPDAGDPAGTEFYGMTTYRASDGYVGFVWVYHTNPSEPMPRQHGTIDIQLAWSEDGRTWKRLFQGQPFLPLGAPGRFDDGMVFITGPPVLVGDELRFYYGAWDNEHGTTRYAAIGLAKLRADGHAYLEPTGASGSLTTPLIDVRGRRLYINADADQGRVRVEVLDSLGQPVPGYSLSECVPVRIDSTRCEVRWSSGSLPTSPRPFKLRFVLEGARLYSFWVDPDPEDSTYWHSQLLADGSTMALWRFDEGSGTAANDSAGSVNNLCDLRSTQGGQRPGFVAIGLTDHGGLHPPADFGYALSFDGATGYGYVSDQAELEWAQFPLTVEFWMKPESDGCILGKYTQAERSWDVHLYRDSDLGVDPVTGQSRSFGDGAYHIAIRFCPGVESLQVSQAAAAPIQLGRWYFVAIVLDAVGEPHIYINGVESKLRWVWSWDNSRTTGVLDSNRPLGMGVYDCGFSEVDPGGPLDPDTSRHFYRGLLDEVRLSRGGQGERRSPRCEQPCTAQGGSGWEPGEA